MEGAREREREIARAREREIECIRVCARGCVNVEQASGAEESES
jgi:hypothetical protein